ncbi:MAG: nucleotide exchange factor GrpE [Actinobacteria bacterium]|nr:nucleotide exchange factor GrpE [Actinomycetota bacterium]
MPDNQRGTGKIKVQDKRRAAGNSSAAQASVASEEPAAVPSEEPAVEIEETVIAEPDYLDDLRRLQADFDNYRKRVARDQMAVATRASGRLIEKILPALDNFEAALAHGEGGPGIEMVYKQLRATLEEEGVKEIPAQDVRFDPNVHEAFEAFEDESVDEPMSARVLRRGYMIHDRVLRPAMVSVARPIEAPEPDIAEG